MNSLYLEVTGNKNIIERHKFMNELEHYLYVTPKHKHSNIPEKYNQIVKSNLFPDLNSIANDIWNGNNTNNIIDCRRIPYLNKCNLVGIEFLSFEKYMNMMYNLRNGNEKENDIMIGGNKYNKFKLHIYKNYLKQLYVNTKINKYKKYYKFIKRSLKN